MEVLVGIFWTDQLQMSSLCALFELIYFKFCFGQIVSLNIVCVIICCAMWVYMFNNKWTSQHEQKSKLVSVIFKKEMYELEKF